MNYITPVNEFIVVKPSGEIIGFKELSIQALFFILLLNFVLNFLIKRKTKK